MTVSDVPRISANWWMFLILGLVSTIAGILAIVYQDSIVVAFRLRSVGHQDPSAAAPA